jgi:hypothetical protein
MRNPIRSISVAALIFVTWAMPAQAIRVCYDYVYYRLTEFIDKTGIDPYPPGSPPGYMNAGHITDYLTPKHYYAMSPTPAPDMWKKGDVIFVSGHVGFVNGPNDIDHYIQLLGEGSDQNVAYPARNLPLYADLKVQRKVPDGFPKWVGGLYRNNSVDDFLGAPFQRPASYQVWRKCEGMLMLGVCSAPGPGGR